MGGQEMDVARSSDILEQVCAADLLERPLSEIQGLAARLTKDLKARGAERKLKIAVISSFLTNYLVEILELMLVRRGIVPEIVSAGYGQLVPEVLTAGPALQTKPDLVLFLPSHRDLRHAPAYGATREEAAQCVREEANFWLDLIARISCPVVMLSFDHPPNRVLGEGDGFLPGGLGRHVRELNLALADELPASVVLVDAEALQRRLGAQCHDGRMYALCKQPFGMDALVEIADTLAAAIVGAVGRARKVLVLDLDNTLWGGVVGDVGVEGLTLGPETHEGEAFVEFQRYAKQLARRGVILAVCSKNNEDVARAAFRTHPAMVLQEEDISCFVANFEDKATNIRRIATTLNVGIDSMVFVDDNPIERSWVSRQLPEVQVIALPEDPALYCQAVEAAKPFPMHRLTKEDLARTLSYRSIAAAKLLGSASVDMDSFLKELEPIASIEPVEDGSIDRIVQLIRKTNQFKLNPTVFTHQEVRDHANSVLAIRLSDRLQDYGIVAIAVTEPEGRTLVVKNWVMSCRVFGRRLENAMREILSERAVAIGADRIMLRFVPSEKNSIVPNILSSIGFVGDDGSGIYEASPMVPEGLPPHYMTFRKRIRDAHLVPETIGT